MDFPDLETDRLYLIQLSEPHVEDFFDILSRDDVTKYYGTDPLNSRDEALEIIHMFQEAYDKQIGIMWSIMLKESNKFIGSGGLSNIFLKGKRADIGFDLHPDYWGSGYAMEACREILNYSFGNLELYRIGAQVYPNNHGSRKLLKRLGFSEEGLLRSYFYQRNQFHDALTLSLLKDDWA